jgi:topoisomerase-4 subunit A
MQPFLGRLEREMTADDVETLLKIPIRRISLYDINRSREEVAQIRDRLREIDFDLNNMVPYAIRFLEDLIERYRDQFPRRTQVTSFAKVSVREAARRDLKLRYDRASGYLGHEVSTGTPLFDVSAYDRVLVVRKEGTYQVIDVPDKLFVGKAMQYCGFVDKDLVFSLVFRDPQGHTCLKRCQIDKFILNRDYELIPADARLLKLITEPGRTVHLEYRPKPRLRVLEEQFAVDDYPVRGLRAGGLRLSTKEVQSVRVS